MATTLRQVEDALQRKDAIIRIRNAQISQLWDELRTRQPWRNALTGKLPIDFREAGKKTNSSRLLAVLGINTVRLTLAQCTPAEPLMTWFEKPAGRFTK